MTIIKKQEMIEQSITGIFALLSEIIRSPEKFIENDSINTRLKSQGSLCSSEYKFSIEDKEFSIHPVSLNTLKKRLLHESLDRNFNYLDRLRVAAKEALIKKEETSSARRRTKSGIEEYNQELHCKIEDLHRTNMVLLQTIHHNLKDFNTISNTGEKQLRNTKIREAIERSLKILSLNAPPFNDISLLSNRHLHLVVNKNDTSK
jgi:hypothetical protein